MVVVLVLAGYSCESYGRSSNGCGSSIICNNVALVVLVTVLYVIVVATATLI